MMKYENHIFT